MFIIPEDLHVFNMFFLLPIVLPIVFRDPGFLVEVSCGTIRTVQVAVFDQDCLSFLRLCLIFQFAACAFF